MARRFDRDLAKCSCQAAQLDVANLLPVIWRVRRGGPPARRVPLCPLCIGGESLSFVRSHLLHDSACIGRRQATTGADKPLLYDQTFTLTTSGAYTRARASSGLASHSASMQRTTASSSSHSQATTALRRTLRSQSSFQGQTSGGNQDSDEDDISDPRPWEKRASLKLYGSKKDSGNPDLPLYNSEDMEARRRFGEKEDVVAASITEKEELLDDDQGKWMKGHGPGPGVGGRRGLPPRQRLTGWVGHTSKSTLMKARGICGIRRMDLGGSVYFASTVDAVVENRSCKLRRVGRGGMAYRSDADFRRISESLDRIISIEISISMFTLLSARCWLVWRVSCLGMEVVSTSSPVWSTPQMSPTPQCEYCSHCSASR